MSVGEFVELQPGERPDFTAETFEGQLGVGDMDPSFLDRADTDRLAIEPFPEHSEGAYSEGVVDWDKLHSEIKASEKAWAALTGTPADTSTAHPETERRGPSRPTNEAVQLEAVKGVADNPNPEFGATPEDAQPRAQSVWAAESRLRVLATFVADAATEGRDIPANIATLKQQSIDSIARQRAIDNRAARRSHREAFEDTRGNRIKDPNFRLPTYTYVDAVFDEVASLRDTDQPDTFDEEPPVEPGEFAEVGQPDVEQSVATEAPKQPVCAREKVRSIGRMAMAAAKATGSFAKRLRTTVHEANVRFDQKARIDTYRAMTAENLSTIDS